MALNIIKQILIPYSTINRLSIQFSPLPSNAPTLYYLQQHPVGYSTRLHSLFLSDHFPCQLVLLKIQCFYSYVIQSEKKKSRKIIDYYYIILVCLIYIYCLGTGVCVSGDSSHTYFTCQMQNHWKS